MSSVPIFPARGIFTPRFILPDELTRYGLPDAKRQPNILSLVDAASVLIDVHCGRIDGSGQGSLVYSTYMERLLMQSRNRNITRVSFKPMVAVDATTVQQLTASANNLPINPATSKLQTGNPLLYTNYFWTGVQANTIPANNVPGSTISPILGCSGRYGATVRASSSMVWPDLNYGFSPYMVAAFFGGAPGWYPINLTLSDFDYATGEVWVPTGIWAAQFTEIVIVYNSGYHPLFLPPTIKQVCAGLVRNYLSKGGGVTGLRSISTAGAANVTFDPEMIDPTLDRMLSPYKVVQAY